jgi:hypothetical protein
MWGFSGKDNIDSRQEVQSTRKMIGFIIGVSLFMMALFRFVPKDLFTTASWLDNKGLGLLYSSEATAFSAGSFWDITNVTVPVSEEAFWFAVMITVLQFAFGYLIGVSGSYVSGREVENPLQFMFMFARGQITATNVNWKKLGYWGTFISLAIFDTYTDWQFSSKFGQGDILFVSLVYSLVIYNVASEFALMYGLQLAIGNAPDAVSGAISTFMAIITAPFNKSSRSSGKGKPQGQEKQQQPQGGRGKPQQQGNPRQQPPGRNNNNGGNRNGNGRNGGAPQSMPMPIDPRTFDPRSMPEFRDAE